MTKTLFTVDCKNPHGEHQMVCHQWGDRDNPKVLICVHGIARNAADFDVVAARLAQHYRVVCPDIVGRGQSDWLTESSDYAMPQYMADIGCLLAQQALSSVDWLGTSMGGILGMCLAAMPDSPIQRLMLNDIGPFVDQAALQSLANYIGERHFADLTQAQQYFQTHYASWGVLSDEAWQTMTQNSVKGDGIDGYCLHYDPAIGDNAQAMAAADIDLWSVWREVRCPVAVMHGETSTILTSNTLATMRKIHPRLASTDIAGVGHVPPLLSEEECAWIEDWFLEAN